jgi:hypothetical protein
MAEEEPHLSGTEARGGQKTGVMRYVLGISLAAIIIIVLLLLIFNR